jgi:hypothetical protein
MTINKRNRRHRQLTSRIVLNRIQAEIDATFATAIGLADLGRMADEAASWADWHCKRMGLPELQSRVGRQNPLA